jgi:alkanesulfonate monooxygenase SsuD/methylene tetrahydromethanopterin reductase-like flavin-dependent oxidoreductase (luciferase family)
VPRPFQKPHPPIWVAATTQDTFPMVGGMGFSLVTGLRGFDVPQIKQQIAAYRAARREAGHPGDGSVYLRIPVYVADTAARARSEPEESTIRSYRRLAENFAASVGEAGTSTGEERARAEALSQATYDELLEDRVAYGTPDTVIDRLRRLREELGLSGVVMEPNVGGRIPPEGMLRSIRLYAEAVAPRLHGDEVAGPLDRRREPYSPDGDRPEPRRRGSSTSRSASPSMLKPKTAIEMAAAGNSAIHGA